MKMSFMTRLAWEVLGLLTQIGFLCHLCDTFCAKVYYESLRRRDSTEIYLTIKPFLFIFE